VLTPSKQLLRHREVGWRGSWTANHCTEVHISSHLRPGVVGKWAGCHEARHCQDQHQVHVAAVVESYAPYLGRSVKSVESRIDMCRRRRHFLYRSQQTRSTQSQKGVEEEAERHELRQREERLRIPRVVQSAMEPGNTKLVVHTPMPNRNADQVFQRNSVWT
jgi:hypothetical protein